MPATAEAQTGLSFLLPDPGKMVGLSEPYAPATLQGIKVFPDNPLKMNFIVDPGESGLISEGLKEESTRLIKYFLSTLTIPKEDLWVNLSPHEKGRIAPDKFGETEMARDLLAQDYLLKQITSSLMYPEGELGKDFWSRLYKTAYERYGISDIPVETFNKVWIVPEKAVVYENGNTAYILECQLDVMLEADYAARQQAPGEQASGNNPALQSAPELEKTKLTQQLMRKIIIPALKKEINEGGHFAPLRQIYHSMILATWYKRSLRASIFGKAYIGKNKVAGINVDDKQIKEKIYQKYLEAMKAGVYNYIKKDYDPVTQDHIPRKYFSGGFMGGEAVDNAMLVTDNKNAPWRWLPKKPFLPALVLITVALGAPDFSAATALAAAALTQQTQQSETVPAVFEEIEIELWDAELNEFIDNDQIRNIIIDKIRDRLKGNALITGDMIAEESRYLWSKSVVTWQGPNIKKISFVLEEGQDEFFSSNLSDHEIKFLRLVKEGLLKQALAMLKHSDRWDFKVYNIIKKFPRALLTLLEFDFNSVAELIYSDPAQSTFSYMAVLDIHELDPDYTIRLFEYAIKNGHEVKLVQMFDYSYLRDTYHSARQNSENLIAFLKENGKHDWIKEYSSQAMAKIEERIFSPNRNKAADLGPGVIDSIKRLEYWHEEMTIKKRYNRLNGLTSGNDDYIATEDFRKMIASLLTEAIENISKKKDSITDKEAYQYGKDLYAFSDKADSGPSREAFLAAYEMYLKFSQLNHAPFKTVIDFYENARKGNIDIEEYLQNIQEKHRKFKEQKADGEPAFDNENENPDDAMLGRDDQVVAGLSQQKNKNDSAKGLTHGGIDLNEDKLELLKRGSGIDFKIPDGQVEAIINAEGFTPVIIQTASLLRS
ncbi:MAG: hypothetical protein KAR05_10200, partial [Candidatus Omnitrophica bacterium]|nr:hypothetical protein [Candidatus Omnitrophota bacterium]